MVTEIKFLNDYYVRSRRLTVCLAVLLTSAVVTSADDSFMGSQREEKDVPGLTYAIGDRLKITVFEQFNRPSLGNANSKALSSLEQFNRPSLGNANSKALSSLVERSEITGEYIVQQDGHVFLPFIGGIGFSGQSQKQLDKAISDQFGRLLNASVRVSIQLLEREPVYVTGSVPRSGIVRYVPGMTVLHALILAGGDNTTTEQWRQIDMSRERERMRKSEERLKVLLAQMEVLTAERERRPAVQSLRLIELAGKAQADELFVQSRRLRNLTLNRVKDETDGYDAMIAAAKSERAVLLQNMRYSETVVQERTERVASMFDLRRRGTINDLTLNTARSELTMARERLDDSRVSIARIERTLAQLRHEQARIVIDAEIGLERTLKETRDSISEEEMTRATIGQLLLGLKSTTMVDSGYKFKVMYKIVRRTQNGLQQTAADETSALAPGDLVQAVRHDGDSLRAATE